MLFNLLFLLVFQELITNSLTRSALIGPIDWILISQVATNIDRPEKCNDLSGLTSRQLVFCKRKIEHMEAIREGARLAIKECQEQFKFRRWNCSTVLSPNGGPIFGKALQGTREAAFVYAISSAGVAYAVTRACTERRLGIKCGCDKTLTGKSKKGWTWAGCSEDINYGIDFSKNFVQERGQDRYSPERVRMNMHNNRAGRKALKDNMKLECKCHGVSGSCAIKTCWNVMPDFSEIGKILKEKFDGATEVELKLIGSRPSLVQKNPVFKPHTQSDLVYIDPSPNFCLPNNKTGSFGTKGRLCNKTSQALDGCELMCCGRGTTSTPAVLKERCKCKFYWCCFVQCQTCYKKVTQHYCK